MQLSLIELSSHKTSIVGLVSRARLRVLVGFLCRQGSISTVPFSQSVAYTEGRDTVHEILGLLFLLAPYIRPIYSPHIFAPSPPPAGPESRAQCRSIRIHSPTKI